MSCKDCENARACGAVFYLRVGNGNMALSGCRGHVGELLDKLDRLEELESELML